jgi:hypothetical protein
MTMKKKILALLCLVLGVWQGAMAEDIDVLYMVTTLTYGTKYEVMLTNESTFTGPKILRGDKTFIINGTTYSADEIGEIRFEKRTIDMITPAPVAPQKGAVYNLNGQKVCDIDPSLGDAGEQNLSSLPKGIYIVNGKKIVVGQ